jgi:seryl-tRNA synthetase
MLDLKSLREDPDEAKAALATRDPSLGTALDNILALDSQRRTIIQTVEAKKAERNSASEEVARRKKKGEDAEGLLAGLKTLSSAIKELDEEMRVVEGSLREALLRIPNIPMDDVPRGDASNNTVVRSWGELPTFAFEPLPHWELGERLGLFDLPRGAKVSGSGFPIFTGPGARLVRGLVSFMLDLHTREHGYVELAPPVLVNEASALGTGQLPDLESQMYVTGDGLYLIPTAEVPVTNFHRDDVLQADDLPIGYAAYSPCFRREAGAHGKDTRGITRVHQFDKVELVRFCEPSASAEEHERLLGHAEMVMQRLGLPYRIVALATGDLGFASAKTYDVELWAAGAGAWLEVSSASTFTDFQARRANIRYRPTDGGKVTFVHTLNASGVALPRTIIGLLENNQRDDGSVSIPAVLVPYVGMDRLTPVRG